MKVISNRRARFDYEILETVEAGLRLTGPEVKSCRAGQVQFAGAYVTFQRGEPAISSLMIGPYPYANNEHYEPKRTRPLLLKKNEIERLQSLGQERGVTIIPMEMKAGKYIKLVLGIGRGRKKADRREVLKKRDQDRALRSGREI